MKTKTKWMAMLAVIAVFLTIQTVTVQAQTCTANATIDFAIVTSVASSNNPPSLQKVMDYMEKGQVIDLIDQNWATNPAALHLCRTLWRVADTIITTPPLKSWRATNNPAGNFINEYGSREAIPVIWSNSVPFLANEIYFEISSSDSANTFRYSGNLATNTSNGALLTFSPTLRGQVWSNEVVVADYYAGENILSHPINRLIAMPRVAYLCADTNQIGLSLSYYRNHMTITNKGRFYTLNGAGQVACEFSKPVHSLAYLDAYRNTNSIGRVYIRGQRELGISYRLLKTYNMNEPRIWTEVASGLSDGSYFDHNDPTAYFEAAESASPPALAPDELAKLDSTPPFQFVGWNN